MGKDDQKIKLLSIHPANYEIDASRRTTLWSYNVFRARILSSLLNDLLLKEESGLNEDECKNIRYFLGRIVNIATDLPDGGFLKKSVFSLISDFEKEYIKWNDINISEPNARNARSKQLNHLRRKRKRIATVARRNQFILEKELDLKIVESIYTAVNELIEKIPHIAIDLAKEYKNFERKRIITLSNN
jgi:hypothetical protein